MSDRGADGKLAEAATLYQAGRHAEAEALARRILAHPGVHAGAGRAVARHLLAGCRAAVGALAEAADELAVLVAEVPGHDDARLQLAGLLARLGRHGDVVALLDGEVRRRPDFLAAYRPLAAALWETGARDAAIALYRGMAERAPQDGAVHRALGDALRHHGAGREAVAVLRRAVALLVPAAPGDPAAFRELMAARVSLAELLAGLATDAAPDYPGATAVAREARTMGVADPDVLVSLGTVLDRAGEHSAAEECFLAALDLRPAHVVARLNLSMVRLLHGDFAQGWRDYEARRYRRDLKATLGRLPSWTAPQDMRGMCVRVLLEQGMGDRLQFARYLPMLAERGAQVEVAVDPAAPLRPLLAEMPAISRLVDADDAPGAPDAVVALMSLPLAFGTDATSIPADVPYLRVPAAHRAKWRARLGAGDGRKRVGVVWWGNPAYANDRARSIPLDVFAPLLDRRQVSFHVLAHQLRPEEAAAAGALATVHEGVEDFADTAALVEAMDLVIAADTAVAHLAGALARPVWILLPFCPDWRWMLAREDSSWYPTARLLRQPARGDWDSVIRRAREMLDATFG